MTRTILDFKSEGVNARVVWSENYPGTMLFIHSNCGPMKMIQAKNRLECLREAAIFLENVLGISPKKWTE
jgi:hypothetical protein